MASRPWFVQGYHEAWCSARDFVVLVISYCSITRVVEPLLRCCVVRFWSTVRYLLTLCTKFCCIRSSLINQFIMAERDAEQPWWPVFAWDCCCWLGSTTGGSPLTWSPALQSSACLTARQAPDTDLQLKELLELQISWMVVISSKWCGTSDVNHTLLSISIADIKKWRVLARFSTLSK